MTKPTPPETILTVPEALDRRRATRRFDAARPLDDSLLREILRLATLAPSGYNLQPWRFLVVRSAANRDRLKACAYGQAKVGEAPAVVILLGYLHPHRTNLDAMAADQVRRGVLTPDEAAGMKGRAKAAMERNTDPTLWATRSAMLGAMALMLAAESLGVQSAPMEGFEPEKVRDAFGIPDDHAVCCLIALGYAAEAKPFFGRFAVEEVSYAEHFGRPFESGKD